MRMLRAVAAVLLGGLLQHPVQAQDLLKPAPGDWTALGEGASAQAGREEGWSRQGRPALDYRYQVGKGQLSLLVLPIHGAALARAGGLSFAVKASHMSNLLLALEEQGGGRWSLPVTVNAGQWQEVRIALDDLVLAVGGDAPPDSNGRLDLERVRRLSVVDVGAMLASKSPDAMRLFGIPGGAHRLALDDLRFTAAGPRADSADSLDGFARPSPPWSTFGASRAEPGREAPLSQPGWVVDYRKQTGAVMSVIRPLPAGALSGADALELSLASRIKTSLVLKLEQSDGDKFEASFDLPGRAELQTVSLKLADFKRSDDSGSRNARPRPERIVNLLLLDIGGLFASKGENRLWLQRVASRGTDAAVAAAGPATRARRPEAPAETVAVEVPGWSRWTKRSQPILAGPYSLVGDPSVLHDGDLYRMFYTCFDPKRKAPAICQASSSDGLAWADVPVKGPLPGRMLETRPGKWDDTHETPFILKFRGEYLLYFAGYRDRGGHFKSFPLQLGLASSRDGVHFERVGDDPILKVSPGGFDSDAVFSPTIVEYQGQLVMLYTGYCFDSCKRQRGVYLMAATSSNGRDWVKREQPVLGKADLPKTKDGAAEAEIVKGPDGMYYLFMSLLYGEQGHEIGVARAASPFGPWELAAEPIVRRSAGQFDEIGPIAPSVLIEGDKVRMWYHGFSKRKTIQIGYAEAPWPLKLK